MTDSPCRACKKIVRLVGSKFSTTVWPIELNGTGNHRCQEYLDNLNNNIRSYFLPTTWSYAPKTVVEQIGSEKHIKLEFRRKKYST